MPWKCQRQRLLYEQDLNRRCGTQLMGGKKDSNQFWAAENAVLTAVNVHLGFLVSVSDTETCNLLKSSKATQK